MPRVLGAIFTFCFTGIFRTHYGLFYGLIKLHKQQVTHHLATLFYGGHCCGFGVTLHAELFLFLLFLSSFDRPQLPAKKRERKECNAPVFACPHFGLITPWRAPSYILPLINHMSVGRVTLRSNVWLAAHCISCGGVSPSLVREGGEYSLFPPLRPTATPIGAKTDG